MNISDSGTQSESAERDTWSHLELSATPIHSTQLETHNKLNLTFSVT